MNNPSFFLYDMFSMIKVKLTYYWWIIGYGGKQNIPKEVILSAMEKTLEDMSFNIEQAFRMVPSDASEEEKKMAFQATVNARKLREEILKIR